MTLIPIAVAEGDGIGPEIMAVVLDVLQAAGANLKIHKVEIGEKMYQSGHLSGIAPDAWDILDQTRAFLKAPITTPQGGGFRSLNVTIRGAFSLFANVRPSVAYHPFVDTLHPEMDVVIIRENEEDLYAGIEYQNTADTVHALKIISRTGCEKIVRYAFEYAVANGRKKVTCFTKDNILKLSDGLFHKVYEEIAQEYPQIENEHWIIDIGAAKLADTPNAFDVVVMPNLYGDILSDVSAQIAGSVGLAGSGNIGPKHAMFEAIHGSAPRRAGQNMANPSGLLLGALMMLRYLGETETANTIHNAWLTTLESGVHTYDIYKEGISKEKVGTKEFGEAIVSNLGKLPSQLKPVTSKGTIQIKLPKAPTAKKELLGIDIYVDWTNGPSALKEKINTIETPFAFTLLTNRGSRIWPDGSENIACVDQYRCRFLKENINGNDLLEMQKNVLDAGLEIVQTENLYSFDGKKQFSLAEY